uniref:Uncharacterized protein n=1 Tax=Arundo donax TaxID=35708 RepID=A0A0A8YBK7_ARUDO
MRYAATWLSLIIDNGIGGHEDPSEMAKCGTRVQNCVKEVNNRHKLSTSIFSTMKM